MKIGICAYPLSKGKETGRGLDRVIDEFYNYLKIYNISFDFYESNVIKDLKGSASLKKEIQSVFYSIKYFRFLKSVKNDVYLATYPVSSIFPALLRKKPLITLIHDLIPFFVHGYDNKIKYSIKRLSIRYSYIKSDIVIVPFKSNKNKLIDLFKINPEKIRVVPYGVNHENYYKDGSINKIPKCVAFLGEAKRAKGLDTLIRAFQNVVKYIPEAKLVIASSGNELDNMKKLANDLLPHSSFTFFGFIEENKMREFYNSAELLIFPSRYGFGLSALEAMACGTPAIVGETLDSTDFIDDKDLLVDTEDFISLGEKIINLLTNKDLYNEKCEYSISTANKYSWKEMSEKYYKICEETYCNFYHHKNP